MNKVKKTKRNTYVLFKGVYYVKENNRPLREMTEKDKEIKTGWKIDDKWEEINGKNPIECLTFFKEKEKQKQLERSKDFKIFLEKYNEKIRKNYELLCKKNKVIPTTKDNLKIVLEYLNLQNWGAWKLPKMEIGYIAHQYDCDGKIATTIKLDNPINNISMFKVGGKRGHLNKYISL